MLFSTASARITRVFQASRSGDWPGRCPVPLLYRRFEELRGASCAVLSRSTLGMSTEEDGGKGENPTFPTFRLTAAGAHAIVISLIGEMRI
jgi:hypothetical protein